MGDISKSTPKKTSRILAALDYSMLASSSSSYTTMQTSQILGKRKSDTFTVSPARRVQTPPDIGSMIHGPHSLFNKPVHATGASLQGFSLRYDDGAPVGRIDQGGPDQEQRLAEFVYNSIENLGDKRSVKDAIQNLGLQRS
ncbi:hypothetical protein BDR07DRAFT_350841 [Suillus spraguei]|nr:hypothetical protein BDR07DRAFT_620117 [Suillus spraguei]KAG2357762.1 hypothetical protein BDR07DRAFT_350841 [Suillus spraguei]